MPESEWPSGMLARGGYTAKTKFVDDDKIVSFDFSTHPKQDPMTHSYLPTSKFQEHLAFTWAFDIKKSWPDEA